MARAEEHADGGGFGRSKRKTLLLESMAAAVPPRCQLDVFAIATLWAGKKGFHDAAGAGFAVGFALGIIAVHPTSQRVNGQV